MVKGQTERDTGGQQDTDRTPATATDLIRTVVGPSFGIMHCEIRVANNEVHNGTQCGQWIARAHATCCSSLLCSLR